MRWQLVVRALLVGLGCLGLAALTVVLLTEERGTRATLHSRSAASGAGAGRETATAGLSLPPFPNPGLPSYPDPATPGAKVFVDPFAFDTGAFSAAAKYTPKVEDVQSLAAWSQAIAERPARAREALQEQDAQLRAHPPTTLPEAFAAIEVLRNLAFVALYEGDYNAASSYLRRGRELTVSMPGMPPEVRAHMTALLGITALRRGEQDNCIGCVGPSSCIFPIAPAAVHIKPEGSREALGWFSKYLEEWPGDLRMRWLLNIAAMTLGQYPDGVPERLRLPIAGFRSKVDIGRFPNVALAAGLADRGPDLAGGSVFDDFDGDDRPDLFVTSFDASHGAGFFHNRGDGTFSDRSADSGLEGQVYALNAARGDYDNDGRLDVLLLRGGWEKPAPLSLLHNEGDGKFKDVTAAAGMDTLIATETAAWGDYDNDGRLDVFVCGEYASPVDPETGQPLAESPDPRNRCRLYHNQGDGTFLDVAESAGVLNERMGKGVAWTDFDNDGRLDLFVSNMNGPGRLYHNQGDGTFKDVAPALGMDMPPRGFTCLAWDYNNDGWQDIFVADYGSSLAGVVASRVGLPAETANRPRLFRNEQGRAFREVSLEAGLDRPQPAMSVNIGDLDNDGDLDLHLGTGWMTLSGLVPDATYLNMDGRFEDVTDSTGTGHLQKGHGVSFADYDADGDVDFFVILGGGFPGDRGYNALFQNPGHGRHWLKVKLVGTRTNRSAIGARLRADIEQPDGSTRTIHRFIGNNGSFGGNTLTEHLGLAAATSLKRLTITWPSDGAEQTFEDLPADQAIVITEGENVYRAIAPAGKP